MLDHARLIAAAECKCQLGYRSFGRRPSLLETGTPPTRTDGDESHKIFCNAVDHALDGNTKVIQRSRLE